MEKVLYIIMGAVAMLLLTPIIHPLSKRLEITSRRFYGISPISVHVERDPAIVWAGFPNWIGAAIWLPELPADPPPEDPTDWHAWARTAGGADASITYLKVTVTCRESTSVVIDPPKVRRDRLPVEDPPKGVVAICPVGGASITPQRIQINLDMASAHWVDQDGNPMSALSLQLEPGESEQFYIYGTADAQRFEWHIELPLIVDGKRQVKRIDDDGRRFMTHGADNHAEYLWHDGQWKDREAI